MGGAELVGDGCRLIGRAGPAAAPDLGGAVRGIGADQTNTTVVLGERAVLKCYRRLGPARGASRPACAGSTAAGFDGVPAMYGGGGARARGVSSALLLVQAYVPGTWDGFAQADRDLRAGAAPGWAPAVGRLVGRMHRALGPGRPATEDDLAAWRAHGRTLVAAMAERSCAARGRGARRGLGRRRPRPAPARRARARRPPSRPVAVRAGQARAP